MKRLGFLIGIVLALVFVAPAHAQKPIFLVPGGGGGVPTANTVPLGTGLSFASIPSVFVPLNAVLQYNTPWTISIGIINQPGAFEFGYVTNGIATIFDDGQNSTLLYGVVIPGSNLVCLSYASLIATTCASQYLVTDGNPHLLTMTNDGTNLRLYVDNGLVDIKPAGSYTIPTTNGAIGNANANITLVDHRQWTRALSASEISTLSALFHMGLVPTTGNPLQTGIVAEWPLGAGTITLPSGTTSGSVTDIINGVNGIIDSTPPTVAVTVPANGATGLSGNVTVTATATDNTKVTKVVLQVDGLPSTTLTAGPFTTTWNSALTFDGSHQVCATATDFVGLTTTSCNTVTTSNGIVANTVKHFATAGNDANGPGCLLATPCQTVAYANTLTLYPTWHLSINGGDTINGCLLVTPSTVVSGGDSAHPVVVDSYGSGQGHINSNCGGVKTATVKADGVSGFTATNLTITAPNGGGAGTLTYFCVEVQNGLGPSAGVSGITISNNNIYGCASDSSNEPANMIYVTGFTLAGACGTVDTISILGNTIGDPSAPAISGGGASGSGCGTGIGNVSNLLEQGNVFKNLGGQQAIFNTGSGTVPNQWNGSVLQFNLTHDNGVNPAIAGQCGGPAGQWAANVVNTTIQFGEAYHQGTGGSPGGGICDQSGFGFDYAVTNSKIQYVYSHDNLGGGFYVCGNCLGGTWGPNTVRYVVLENNDQLGNSFYFGELALGKTSGLAYFYNISVYDNQTFTTGIPTCIASDGQTFAAGSILANVICQMAGRSTTFNEVLFWSDNHAGNMNLINLNADFYYTGAGVATWNCNGTGYTTVAAWGTACNGASPAGWITSNPQYTGSLPAGNLTWTPSSTSTWPPSGGPAAYVISTTASLVIGTGANLTVGPYSLNIGTRDYYANTIPSGHGTGYNYGSDGGFP